LNRFIWRSRRLVGWCEFSARLFSPLCRQCFRITPALNQNVEHDAVLIDGAPQPVRRPGDLDDDFIEVPLVAGPRQAPPDFVREPLAKLRRPLPHRLVTDDDAAGGQHLLNHSQAQREAEIQPDRVADDLGWKAVTGVSVRSERRHPDRTPAAACHGNSTGSVLTIEGTLFLYPNGTALGLLRNASNQL
jgi:hypothetical protein